MAHDGRLFKKQLEKAFIQQNSVDSFSPERQSWRKQWYSECFKAPLRSPFPDPETHPPAATQHPSLADCPPMTGAVSYGVVWKVPCYSPLALCPCPRLAPSQRQAKAQAYWFNLLCSWVGQPLGYNSCSRAPREVKLSHTSAETTPLPNSFVAQSCFPPSLRISPENTPSINHWHGNPHLWLGF